MRTLRAHLVWLAALAACCGTVRASPEPEEPPREKVAAEDFRALMAGELAWIDEEATLVFHSPLVKSAGEARLGSSRLWLGETEARLSVEIR